jgi:hypothetical protein
MIVVVFVFKLVTRPREFQSIHAQTLVDTDLSASASGRAGHTASEAAKAHHHAKNVTAKTADDDVHIVFSTSCNLFQVSSTIYLKPQPQFKEDHWLTWIIFKE